jgi:N-acetyl-anhydromuramyl-L-alanine amidase AmpD
MTPLSRLASGLASVAMVAALACAAEAGSRGPKRTTPVTEIIIHATGGPSCQLGRVVFSPAGDVDRIRRFFESSRVVSIHYIVGRDGETVASVPEDEIANHTRDNNDASIGIELINGGDGRDPYPEAQLAALTRLVASLRARWKVPLDGVKGHDDVDQSTITCGGRVVRRKQDPGPAFPWARFRQDLVVAAAAVHGPRAARR